MTAGRYVSLPPGLVPRFLSREEAARYVGVSATTFDDEVRAGRWPAAEKRGAKGGRLTWDRMLLDAYADRRSGLVRAPGHPASAEAGEAADLVAEQMQISAEEAALRAVTERLPPRRRALRLPPPGRRASPAA